MISPFTELLLTTDGFDSLQGSSSKGLKPDFSKDFRSLLERILKNNSGSSSVFSSLKDERGVLSALAPLLTQAHTTSISGSENASESNTFFPISMNEGISSSFPSEELSEKLTLQDANPLTDIKNIIDKLHSSGKTEHTGEYGISPESLWKAEVLRILSDLAESGKIADVPENTSKVPPANGLSAPEAALMNIMTSGKTVRLDVSEGGIDGDYFVIPASVPGERDSSALSVRILLQDIAELPKALPARLPVSILSSAPEDESGEDKVFSTPFIAAFSAPDIDVLRKIAEEVTYSTGEAQPLETDLEEDQPNTFIALSLNTDTLQNASHRKAEAEIVRALVRELKNGIEVTVPDTGSEGQKISIDFDKIKEPGRTFLERSGNITTVTLPIKPVSAQEHTVPAVSSGAGTILAEDDAALTQITRGDYSSFGSGNPDDPFDKSLSVSGVPSEEIKSPYTVKNTEPSAGYDAGDAISKESPVHHPPDSITIELDVDDIVNGASGEGKTFKAQIPVIVSSGQTVPHEQPGEGTPEVQNEAVQEIRTAPFAIEMEPEDGSRLRSVSINTEVKAEPKIPQIQSGSQAPQILSESTDVPRAGELSLERPAVPNNSEIIVLQKQLNQNDIDKLTATLSQDSGTSDVNKSNIEKIVRFIQEEFAAESGLNTEKTTLVLDPEQVSRLAETPGNSGKTETIILSGKIVPGDGQAFVPPESEQDAPNTALTAGIKGTETSEISKTNQEPSLQAPRPADFGLPAEKPSIPVYVRIPAQLISLMLSGEGEGNETPGAVTALPPTPDIEGGIQQAKNENTGKGAQYTTPETERAAQNRASLEFIIPARVSHNAVNNGVMQGDKITENSPDLPVPDETGKSTAVNETESRGLKAGLAASKDSEISISIPKSTGGAAFVSNAPVKGNNAIATQSAEAADNKDTAGNKVTAESAIVEEFQSDEQKKDENLKIRQSEGGVAQGMRREAGIRGAGAPAEKSAAQNNQGVMSAGSAEGQTAGETGFAKQNGEFSRDGSGKEQQPFFSEVGAKSFAAHNVSQENTFAEHLQSGKHTAEQNFESIVQKIKFMSREGLNELEMHLNPPELGKIHIRLSSDHSKMIGQIGVENHAIKSLFDEQLPKLQEALSGNGVQVENLEVFVRNGQDQPSQNFFGNTDNKRHGMRGDRNGKNPASREESVASTGRIRNMGYNSWELVA